MNNLYQYPGKELAIFEEAKTWKRYFAKKIQPYVHGTVLEVGAGLGATTSIVNNGSATSWTMLEPDEGMYRSLLERSGSLPSNTNVLHGMIADVHRKANTILYIDVLEHIENDTAELSAAAEHLDRNGYLVVLAPAFNFLYSKFDASIGHHRRYNKPGLKKIAPASVKLISTQYLDSCGFFASMANKFFLHQSVPSAKQIRFWDKYLIPVSEITDRLFLYSFGKSILTVWEKQ